MNKMKRNEKLYENFFLNWNGIILTMVAKGSIATIVSMIPYHFVRFLLKLFILRQNLTPVSGTFRKKS